jgi:hypothetical protein
MAMVIAIEYAMEAKSWNQRKMEKVRTNARDRTRDPTRPAREINAKRVYSTPATIIPAFKLLASFTPFCCPFDRTSQNTVATRPEAIRDQKLRTKTPNRTGMQKQKCLD